MAGIEFLEILLKHGGIGFLVVGNNFRCGYRLDTKADEIQRFFASHNIPVKIVPEVMENSLPISSSRIRSAIISGDLSRAQAMLGYPYTIDLADTQDIVLPPPGKYQVLLRSEDSLFEDSGTKAEIFIEDRTVRIPETLADSHWGFAEFLPDSVTGTIHDTENNIK
jgi:riboflavin kinase/FMN adenylyltransferase